MHKRKIITASVVTAIAGLGVLAGVAQASTFPLRHPTVSIDDHNGHLTTGSYVFKGENLALYGYGPQNAVYSVVNVTDVPNGTFKLTLAGPPLPLPPGENNNVFDFIALH